MGHRLGGSAAPAVRPGPDDAGLATLVCTNCGEHMPDRYRFCGMCGAPLATNLGREVRKTVTIVFSDLVGSTAMAEKLDSETLWQVLSLYFEEMTAVLHRHGGTVEKFIGDAIVAVFGLAVAHEDDALRAVRAAWEMNAALVALNDRLEAQWGVRLANRTGVTTGEVVAGDPSRGQHLVTGDPVNTAARYEQNAPTFGILLGEPTYRLVADAVEVEPLPPMQLKGKSHPLPVYLVKGVGRQEGVARRMDAPLVGRQEELALLLDSLDRTVKTRHAELVTLLASPGVGKSRLLLEFVSHSAGQARALRGRCLSYGEDITFWPLIEILWAAAGIEEDDDRATARTKLDAQLRAAAGGAVDRVASAIGLSDKRYPVQEVFWGISQALRALAAPQPLLLIIEDLHWAAPTFLDLLEHLVADLDDAPVMIACSARPELLEDRPDWAAAQEHTGRVSLGPLSEVELREIIDHLLAGASLDEQVTAQVLRAAHGNPFFVEQLVAMLSSDEGTTGASLEIPDSITALLSARLDRLTPVERMVCERASVIGQQVDVAAVAALTEVAVAGQVRDVMRALERKQLLACVDGSDEETYRFVHILVRDAAYRVLLKRTRADLHERFVDWLEAQPTGRVTEYEEIRGYHLEQAHYTLLDLGLYDRRAREAGIRAAGYLRSAGERALASGDMPAAAGLLQRAAAVLPAHHRSRTELLLHAAEARFELGQFPQSEQLLAEQIEAAEELGERALRARGELALTHLRFTTAAAGTESDVMAQLDRLSEVLERADDHAGLARAWRLRWLVHGSACQYGAAEEAAKRTIDHAAQAGDRLLEARSLSSLAMCALYGPTPVGQAMAICRDILGRTQDRKARALTSLVLGRLHAMVGELDRARDLYTQSRRSLDELGWHFHAALTSIISGPIELDAGNLDVAERELRRDHATLQAMGERNYIATVAGWLAQVLCAAGRDDDAETYADQSREVAAPDDVASLYLWQSAKALVLARRGHMEQARRLATSAVELAMRSDDLDGQARMLLNAAEVLALSGRPEAAGARAGEAARRFRAKGDIVAAERAEQFSAVARVAPARPVTTRG